MQYGRSPQLVHVHTKAAWQNIRCVSDACCEGHTSATRYWHIIHPIKTRHPILCSCVGPRTSQISFWERSSQSLTLSSKGPPSSGSRAFPYTAATNSKVMFCGAAAVLKRLRRSLEASKEMTQAGSLSGGLKKVALARLRFLAAASRQPDSDMTPGAL